jgi:hypothetical protein
LLHLLLWHTLLFAHCAFSSNLVFQSSVSQLWLIMIICNMALFTTRYGLRTKMTGNDGITFMMTTKVHIAVWWPGSHALMPGA